MVSLATSTSHAARSAGRWGARALGVRALGVLALGVLALGVLALGVLALGVLTPDAAEAQAREGTRVVAHEQLVGLLNPMGAEHRFDVALRDSIGPQAELLFTGAHAQAGALTYLSPVYAYVGGFVELQPLSFFGLHAELLANGVWPIGMDGAGHYALPGYDAELSSSALPAEQGGSATGWTASGTVTLQGALDVWSDARVLVLAELTAAYAVLGSDAFYDSMRYDLALAREDVIVTESAFVGLEQRVASDAVLRVGAYDDLRHVPRSGYVGHQLGALAMLEWARPTDHVDSLTAFLRGGIYTHHAFRVGEPTVLAGVSIDYDLGGLR